MPKERIIKAPPNPSTFHFNVILLSDGAEADQMRSIMNDLGMPVMNKVFSVFWDDLGSFTGPSGNGEAYKFEMVGLETAEEELKGPIFRLKGFPLLQLWRQRIFYKDAGLWEPSPAEPISPKCLDIPFAEALWNPGLNRVKLSLEGIDNLGMADIGKLKAGYDYMFQPRKPGPEAGSRTHWQSKKDIRRDTYEAFEWYIKNDYAEIKDVGLKEVIDYFSRTRHRMSESQLQRAYRHLGTNFQTVKRDFRSNKPA